MPTATLEERPAHTISASEMARRSAAARRAKSANRKAPVKSVYQADEYHTFIRNLGTRCQFMLDRCCLLFDKAKSGTEADKVASAVVKLFDVWADITQTPRRGVLRPEKMKGLIRSYGMKSAMEKMLTQPSIVMGDETATQQPKDSVTNKGDGLGLTPSETPPTPNQEPPSDPLPKNAPLDPEKATPNDAPITPPIESPINDADLLTDDQPEPDASNFSNEQSILNSQAGPVTPITTPTPENG